MESFFYILKTEIGGANVAGEYESGLFFLYLFSSRYNNFPQWEKEEYTKIFSKGILSKKSLKYAEEILMNELPAIPVSNQTNSFFMGNLKNFIFPKFAYSDFKWVKK